MKKESIAFLIMIVSFITGLVCMSLLIAYGLAPNKTDLILWRLWAVLILIEIPFIISLFYVTKKIPEKPTIPNDWDELKRQSKPLNKDLLNEMSELVKNVDIGELD